MSTPAIRVTGASRRFAPRLNLGERIAAWLGATVETRPVQAVSDVSLEVASGETLGLVGESGCGKSTLGRLIAGILPPSEGVVAIHGAPVLLGGRKTTTRVQTVFQDPFASLNPRQPIGEAITEGPVAHRLIGRAEAPAAAAEWLRRVGLDPGFASRYPHQFSGGQRQRVAIARALAMRSDIVVWDEPVASLDVSIQAQIVNLFLELRRELGLTSVFISHDLSIVRHVSDRVAIMYLGRIVELAPAPRIYAAPLHPYTRALLESVPKLILAENARAEIRPIAGEIPSPLAPPPGCAFHPRCPIATALCREQRPPLRPHPAGGEVACHHA